MQIGGGATQLKNFVSSYKKNFEFSNPIHPAKPVICLFDNDKAGREVTNLIKNIYGIDIPKKTGDIVETGPFNIFKNLWVLFTPAVNSDTAIEDCYPIHIRQKNHDGKEFSSKSTTDSATHYGKNTFANIIVPTLSEKDDFEGFLPLLNGIEAVLGKFYE